MLFSSFEFFVLVLVSFSVYYFPLSRRFQLLILMLSSFVFYAYNSPRLLILLLVSIAINVITSYLIVYGRYSLNKLYAITGVTLNLSILGFFKYGTLIGATFSFDNKGVEEFLIQIPLPIGISFFTFQGISLIVDTYVSKGSPELPRLIVNNFRVHALRISGYISFFAQLVAGPIVKSHEFLPQIETKKIRDIDWNFAYTSLIVGYFLKMVIANNLSDYTFRIIFPHFMGLSSLTLVSLLFGYSIQIFADFAGYSLIALGIASLFGYRFPQNFNFPYIALSFSEFWSRWHISLSTFLRQYLYIPLGGNKKGKWRTYFNLFVTMVLGGLWHGATWSYAVWGAVHGALLVLERILGLSKQRKANGVVSFFRWFVVFICVTLAWLLFKLPRFENAVDYLISVGRNIHYKDSEDIIRFVLYYSLPVIIYHALYLLNKNHNFIFLKKMKPYVLSLLLFLIFTDSGPSFPFIYFQF